jgi:cysteinyl-tRNA synthetase
MMPTLRLHNSLTRKTEAFAPLDPGHVRIYVCGPTVYDRAHIGNARSVVVFDVLTRLLRTLYPRVTYVRNVTDVDDKINARAKESGVPILDITTRTLADFHADMEALGALPPDIEPRATAHIAEMIAIVERLIAAGHAYEAEGHVLFAVGTDAEYGRLSGRSPEDLLAGARVEVAPYKRDAGDFVLWKPSSDDLPGWASPWGRGRPGWHIECSAMSWRYLGETFDLHGGGDDLLFPHHENEFAQSRCAFPGSSFAKFWVHNGMLTVDGQKMSKSLGNFFTVEQVLEMAPGEAIRMLLLRGRYSETLDFSQIGLNDCKHDLDRFYRAVERNPGVLAASAVPEEVLSALCDDLNTPAAFSAMHKLASAGMAGDSEAASKLLAAGKLLGFLTVSPNDWFRSVSTPAPSANFADSREVEALIDDRLEARRVRDFARADTIRKELAERGVILEDGKDPTTGVFFTTWRRA